MIKKIFKYPIPVADAFEISLPENAQILTVQAQFEDACLWALVDPEARTEIRILRIFGTGHPVDGPINNLKYISTFQLNGGQLVFHVFEVLIEKE